MLHTFLKRKFNADSKTVGIITVASKLAWRELIFQSVFWRPPGPSESAATVVPEILAKMWPKSDPGFGLDRLLLSVL